MGRMREILRWTNLGGDEMDEILEILLQLGNDEGEDQDDLNREENDHDFSQEFVKFFAKMEAKITKFNS